MVVNGMLANQTTFNNAFMSRTALTTSTVAKVALQNTDTESGSFVTNTQRAINKNFEGVGATGEADANINVYANHNYIASGDNRKVAIGKIDAQLKQTQDDLDAAEVIIADHEVRLDNAEATIANHEARLDTIENENSTFNGDKVFTGDVLIQGDIEVQGTRTFLNTQELDIEDALMTVNKGGTNLSAEGSGFQVERVSGGNGAVQFDSTLASKWKIGIVGALYEVVVSGIAQTISGIKDFVSGIKTDTINESTADAGVTVDGLLIKDLYVAGHVDFETKSETVAAAGNFTAPTKKLTYYEIQSTGGAVQASSTPFGSGTMPTTNVEIQVLCKSDVDTVEFTHNDSAKGLLLNGNILMKRGTTLHLLWSVSLQRFVEISRNELGV